MGNYNIKLSVKITLLSKVLMKIITFLYSIGIISYDNSVYLIKRYIYMFGVKYKINHGKWKRFVINPEKMK